jgi:hypothetical protein
MNVLLILVFLLTGTTGQEMAGRYPVKKLYAFRQSVSGGANMVVQRQQRPDQRYLLYLQPWPGKEINIINLWVEGTACSFNTQNVATPVVQRETVALGRKKGTRTLVPGNGAEVLEIVTGTATANGAAYPAQLKTFPVLLQYEFEGKTYYLGGSWKQLPSIVRQ